jgi:hypothetical protein
MNPLGRASELLTLCPRGECVGSAPHTGDLSGPSFSCSCFDQGFCFCCCWDTEKLGSSNTDPSITAEGCGWEEGEL